MTKTTIPYATDDVSALARHLSKALAARDELPGHVEMLNILAQATGARNFQHFRAQAVAATRLAEAPVTEPAIDHVLVDRVLGHFDDQGRLIRWPTRPGHQDLALWPIWGAIPPGQNFTEIEISRLIQALHLFGDPAILRRSMVAAGLLSRTLDCRDYRRIEQQPKPNGLALIRALSSRARAG